MKKGEIKLREGKYWKNIISISSVKRGVFWATRQANEEKEYQLRLGHYVRVNKEENINPKTKKKVTIFDVLIRVTKNGKKYKK